VGGFDYDQEHPRKKETAMRKEILQRSNLMKYPGQVAWEHSMTSIFKKEEMRRFADRITPKSWNIILHEKNALETAGVLNILLSIQGQDSQVYADRYGNKCYEYKGRYGEKYFANRYGDVLHKNQVKPVLGMVLGRMTFKELKSFGGDKKGKIAKIIVQLWPHIGDWRVSLVHELAHVAVYRWRAFMTKDYKKQGLFKRYVGENLRTSIIREQWTMENHHGFRFQKALLSLAKRAIREFEEEIPGDDVFWDTLRFELESFTFAKMDRNIRPKKDEMAAGGKSFP
jgi:hypothetical protein